MRWFLSISILVCVAMSGCRATMNVQRATLRSSGDVGVTVYLDRCSVDTVTGKIEKVKEAVDKLLSFIEDGSVANLIPSQLRLKLMEQLPIEYALLVDNLVAVVSMEHFDAGMIGAKNVKRMKAFLGGLLTGLDSYDVADRGVKEPEGTPELRGRKVIIRQ